jgi:hypothetical protein
MLSQKTTFGAKRTSVVSTIVCRFQSHGPIGGLNAGSYNDGKLQIKSTRDSARFVPSFTVRGAQ